MTGILLDARVAIRSLLRVPGLALIAVLTLGLGIGLDTALFSLVDVVVLRALPYADADRLIDIHGRSEERSGMRVPVALTEAIRARARTIGAVAIHGPTGGVLRTTEGPIDIRGRRVSPNYLAVLGVAPSMGRGFSATGVPEVIVGHRFWQRYLAGDPNAIGRVIQLDSLMFTVVGVMARDFRTTFSGSAYWDFWTTHVNAQVRAFEQEEGYELVARLAPGADLEQAQNELQTIAATVDVQAWREGGVRLHALPLKNEIIGDRADGLLLLMTGGIVVLLVVCANLALLMLARADLRAGDYATRQAIGARPAQLFRLALLDSLMLSIAGGMAGIALAYGALPIMLALAPAEIPRIADAAIEVRALSVGVIMALATGLVFGLLPAWRASRAQARIGTTMRARSSIGAASFRSSLIAAQVAASVTLCVLGGLVGRTFLTLTPTDPGFDAHRVSVYSLYISPREYDAAARIRLFQEITRRARSIPGVEAAASATGVPFSGDESTVEVHAEGGSGATAVRRTVSIGFFDLLRIPLLRGRDFGPMDGAQSQRVVLINEAMARVLSPGGDVLGHRVRLGTQSEAREVLGVVANTRSSGESIEPQPELYLPDAQSPTSFAFIIVRSALSPARLTELLNREVRVAAPELPQLEWREAQPLQSLVGQSLAGPRLLAALASTFSLFVLLLAGIAVAGVVAHGVTTRRRELSLRAALGARSLHLAQVAMTPALVATCAGVVVGLVLAAGLTRFVEVQLFAVERLDTATFVSAAILVLAAATTAAAIPARRAVRSEPGTVLREE